MDPRSIYNAFPFHRNPHIHLAIFTMLNDSDARLDIQNMEYKFVELMYCICARSSDDIIQHHITF
eukprot:gene38558-47616_t